MFKGNVLQYSRNLTIAAGVLLAAAGITPQLKASDLNKEVTMTFSSPVEIPGHILPAGTYTFRRWNMFGNPNAMFVYNSENQLIGTAMTLPTYENDAPPQFNAGGGDARSDINVRFDERAANTEQSLRSWNYPGDPTGFRFVYPQGSTGSK